MKDGVYMEEKLIVKAEIVSYLVVKVFCNDGKEYIVNFMRTNHQIYDPLKEVDTPHS